MPFPRFPIRLNGLALTLMTAFATTGCFLDAGTIRTAKPITNARLILIGPIENRDPKFNAHLAKNFADRLSLELVNKGFDPYLVPPEELATALKTGEASTEPAPKPKKPEATKKKGEPKNEDPDEDIPPAVEPTVLLPEKLRNLAGEGLPDSTRPPATRLEKATIIRLAKAGGFRFFIQGAISRTEQGVLLDVTENSFVFLEVWTADGKRIGLVHYSVHDRTLQEAQLLDQTAPRIAEAIAQTITQAGR